MPPRHPIKYRNHVRLFKTIKTTHLAALGSTLPFTYGDLDMPAHRTSVLKGNYPVLDEPY